MAEIMSLMVCHKSAGVMELLYNLGF